MANLAQLIGCQMIKARELLKSAGISPVEVTWRRELAVCGEGKRGSYASVQHHWQQSICLPELTANDLS